MTHGHAKSRSVRSRAIPPVWLMTDERIGEGDLLRAVARLPRGSAVILRHYSLPGDARYALFKRIGRAARRRGVQMLLAGGASLARSWGADGHHGRTSRGLSAKLWLHSAPVHNMHELREAERAGADALLISPLFATRSHPGARPMGACRFTVLARAATVPVIALGGVRPRHAALLRRLGASGFAAIDGLVARSKIG